MKLGDMIPLFLIPQDYFGKFVITNKFNGFVCYSYEMSFWFLYLLLILIIDLNLYNVLGNRVIFKGLNSSKSWTVFHFFGIMYLYVIMINKHYFSSAV